MFFKIPGAKLPASELKKSDQLIQNTDRAKLVEQYQKAADQGEPDAQYHLGRCYDNGEGVTQDTKKAVELYKKAAVGWYKEAAKQGDAIAFCHLGFCYEKGEGVAKDIVKAEECYRNAAKQQLQLVEHFLLHDTDHRNMIDLHRAPYKEPARHSADTQYYLGHCYDRRADLADMGVKLRKTFWLYQKQSDLYEETQTAAELYLKAAEWYERAIEEGHPGVSYSYIGHRYLRGIGHTQDNKKALECFMKAIEQGDRRGAYGDIGYCHLKGIGTPPDDNKASEWFQKAVDLGSRWAKQFLDEILKKRAAALPSNQNANQQMPASHQSTHSLRPGR